MNTDDPLHEFGKLDELRKALLEDLACAGQSLLTIKEMTKDDAVESLMAHWKWQRFTSSICEAATATIRAMDCLAYKESPTTEALIEEVLARWGKSNDKSKEEIVSKFREAFTKPAAKVEQKPEPPRSNR